MTAQCTNTHETGADKTINLNFNRTIKIQQQAAEQKTTHRRDDRALSTVTQSVVT